MEFVKKIEDKLAELFKSAPKLSDSSKETLVKIWPWLALIGGILQLLAGLWMFRWAKYGSDVIDRANDFYRSIGVDAIEASRFSVWVWLGLIFLIAQGVLLLLAYPKLTKRLKSGWDLLFLVGLLNVLYAVISLFIEGRGGFFSLIWNLLISAVGFWLLFATRDKYKGVHVSPVGKIDTPKAEEPKEAPKE